MIADMYTFVNLLAYYSQKNIKTTNLDKPQAFCYYCVSSIKPACSPQSEHLQTLSTDMNPNSSALAELFVCGSAFL
jgi:hypothetical protein